MAEGLHAPGELADEPKQAEDHLERLQQLLLAHLPSSHLHHEPATGCFCR